MTTVTLHVYDLSQGMARQLSSAFLGRQIDGIWHTGIEVYGREYYFGGGICSDAPNQTPYGTPYSVESLGSTSKTKEEFLTFLGSICRQFSLESYHLLENNCNNFSDACSMFLLDKHIPQYILDLPAEAMNSPLGPMIRPIIDQMQAVVRNQSAGHEEVFNVPRNERIPQSQNSANITTVAREETSIDQVSDVKRYWRSPVLLSKANRRAIRNKLNQFDSSFPVDSDPPFSKVLSASRTWSVDKVFPLLDYLRLYVLEDSDYASTVAKDLASFFERFVAADDTRDSACMMTLRIAVNMFAHKSSTAIICEAGVSKVAIVTLCAALESTNPQVRKTAALLALNYVGAAKRYPDVRKLDEDDTVMFLYSAVMRLNADPTPNSDEATPLMQALAILADGSEDAKGCISAFELNMNLYFKKESCPDDDTRTAAERLSRILSA
ncbi:Desumoylating isopeptidase 1 [Gracilariopsis chorda]|uniref:Desumoylating isopeptidase 1 n=1 Tax=Gracilariopsis chorda TaxID=448386 RepID=A0A2V3IUW6_9FLOR|nr:Desumoylating isopeptidase 1 [Gracilariopsis chorda]|eukprot:PXF45879.1 Desumoylating isopeptidase 1 [Gracilariopsis chorda]